MTFASFAPCHEDAILWRALHTIASGCYVDAGRQPASGSSYTRGFSEMGWHGILIRPSAEQGETARGETVLDIGSRPDLPDTVHVARIDLGYADAIDIESVRPWIVMIGTHDLVSAAALGKAGYQLALKHTANDFFTAPDQQALAVAIAAGATDGDGASQAALMLERSRTLSIGQRLLDASVAAGQFRSDAVALTQETAWLRGLLDDLRSGQARSQADQEWFRNQVTTTQAALGERQAHIRALSEEVVWLRGCVSENEAASRRLQAEVTALDGRLRHALEAEQAARASEKALHDSFAGRMRFLSWRITGRLRPVPGLEPARVQATAQALQPPAIAPAIAPAVTPPPATPAAQPIAARPIARRNLPAHPALPPAPIARAPEQAPLVHGNEPSSGDPQASIVSRRDFAVAVHQFHAGSAPHDAVTNSMLLVRKLLQAEGLRSDIFVESLAAGVDPVIQAVGAMPDHDEFVLLLHHSTGHPGFPALLARPQPIVLMYHNITTPGALGDDPGQREQARLGREQLARLRDRVAFALAPSEFSAAELYRLGFPAVRVCPLLFDADALVARASGHRTDSTVFTVLFVGRVTQSKAQDALIAAFALFRGRLGRPCRLVLAGALSITEHAYLARLRDQIARSGLEQHVLLPGLVPDAELAALYSHADLYVSLSRHEGFGVPLIEALAHDIPVLAWPTGAIPYTVGRSATMLQSRDPADVADAMLAATRRPHAGNAATLRAFRLENQLPVLLTALAAAGALSPRNSASSRAIQEGWRFLVTGPDDQLARQVASSIEQARPGTARLDVADQSNPLTARAIPDTGPELLIACGPCPVAQPADIRAAYLPSPAPIDRAEARRLSAAFDLIGCDTPQACRSLMDAGVCVPVVCVGPADEAGALAEPFADAAARVLTTRRLLPTRVAWVAVRDGEAGRHTTTMLEAFPATGGVRCMPIAYCAASPSFDAKAIADQVVRADPDLVVLQVDTAVLGLAGLHHLLTALQTYEVVMDLHDASGLAGPTPKTGQALSQVTCLVVHDQRDWVQARQGLPDARIVLLPSPAPRPSPGRIRGLEAGAAPVVACLAGVAPVVHAALRAALPRLRSRWPGLRLHVFDVTGQARGTGEPREEDGVAWFTGPAALDGLADCDLIVLTEPPTSRSHLHSVLASGVPVAVLPLPGLDELSQAVIRLPGPEAAEVEIGIANLLGAPDRRAALVSEAAAWLAGRAAPGVASHMHDILLGIVRQRRIGVAADGALRPLGR